MLTPKFVVPGSTTLPYERKMVKKKKSIKLRIACATFRISPSARVGRLQVDPYLHVDLNQGGGRHFAV